MPATWTNPLGVTVTQLESDLHKVQVPVSAGAGALTRHELFPIG